AGLFAYLSFLSHLVGLAVLATGWGWVILRHRRVPVIARLAVFSVIFAVLAAPWVVVLAQRADVSHPPARGLTLLDAPYALFSYVGGYSLGPGLRDLQNLGALGAVRANLPETILAVSILCGLGAVAVQARFAAPVHLWILLVVPILFTLAGAVLSDFPFNVRYTLLALPGFLGLIGCLVGTLRPLLRGVALCVIVGTFLLADFQWFAVQRYWKEDTRGAVGWLREHVAPGARVAVVPDYMTLPLAYYASRAGFDATFAGLAGRADLHVGPPATGLVVTREHHVAEPRLIESEFALAAGGHVVTGAVPGYRLFAAARDARRSRVTQRCPGALDESDAHNSVDTLQLID
ncbi:MAG TPA: hypothetical protein VFP98_06895, partial [Candidatus Polarisedimenticolia bacterium]|nr:hypothetical protein [Candidatus Polarisedimenticolia bacterium]